MINAFHSNWTRPFFYINGNEEYYIEDFEILTTILSALKWREKNGSIKMITDEVGAEYYKKIGLETLWDLGVEADLDKIETSINPEIFWAAGKIYALKKQKSPICSIDTDFIVWKNIEQKLKDTRAAVIHKEKIQSSIYPDKEFFTFNKRYKFDSRWDWTKEPCNTAFTYINDKKLIRYYTKSAIKFMKSLGDSNNRVVNMVFAEQRLMSMCADKMKIEIKEIYDLNKLYNNEQEDFTHIWGYKQVIKNDYKKRREFCQKCIIRILSDFPEYEENISSIDMLKQYYNDVKRNQLIIK